MGYTIWPDGKLGDAVSDAYSEVLRQESLKAKGKFPHTAGDPLSAAWTAGDKLAVLVEEIGEVARVLNEKNGAKDKHNRVLRDELIQVAAVALNWASSLPRD